MPGEWRIRTGEENRMHHCKGGARRGSRGSGEREEGKGVVRDMRGDWSDEEVRARSSVGGYSAQQPCCFRAMVKSHLPLCAHRTGEEESWTRQGDLPLSGEGGV